MKSDRKRIQRLLAVLNRVQGGKGWTARRLADDLGISERSVFRDLNDLEKAGVQLLRSDGDGYSVCGAQFLPPMQLTVDEALALAILADKIGKTEAVPLTLPASKALTKIRAQLPGPIRDQLEPIESRLSVKLAAASGSDGIEDVYQRVSGALTRKQSLRCTYESAQGNGKGKSAKEFILKPYALMFNTRSWYVIGHHDGYGAVRTLKLGRFTKCQQSAAPYEIPSDFSTDKYLGNAWRMIRGGKSYDVKLRFDAAFAETVSDTNWHATQVITPNDDGSCTFECRVDGLDEIVWWVLSMGPHCQVEGPPELRTQVATLAANTAKLYAGAT